MAHGDQNEFGLLVEFDREKVEELKSKGIEHSYTGKDERYNH